MNLGQWQLVHFVHHANLTDLLELDRFESNILFIAKHAKLEKLRLFNLRTDPWVSSD